MKRKITDIAVVGGGRWGLVICSVLERIVNSEITVWLLSGHLPAARVPARVRRIFDASELSIPGATGAAIIATAPHDHAAMANTLLSGGWDVLIEKPVALSLADAQGVAEKAEQMQRQAWAGLVYLFATYLSVMRPHSFGKTRWLLHWFEPDQETRWGELKSTPHHVNAIEDIFPHAWSILRAAGLAAPLRIHQVEVMQPWSVRLTLMADDAIVEMIFDRHGTHRRRFLRLDTGDHTYELDFSEEPGIFLVDGVIAEAPPWNPEMRPLSLELSAFFATCAGGAMPDAPVAVSQSLEAVALMEDATKVFMELQARAVADAMCCAGPQLGPVRVLFDALCREAAMAGVRLSGSSEEGQALLAAAHAFVSGEDSAFVRPLSRFGAVAAHSSFLAQVRQKRKEILAGRDKACRNGGSRE